MDRISTYGLSQSLQASALRLQSTLATKQSEQASGLAGQTYGDLGGQAGRLISLEGEIARAQSWSSGAQSASDRVQAMTSAVGSMVDLVTSLRSEIGAAMSTTGSSNGTINAQGSAALADLANLLNTQQGGRYLFAGARTDTAPVDTTSYAASANPTVPDTSYYRGDDTAASVRTSAEQTIAYGVTADNPAFEEALRAASIAANVSTNPVDSTALKQAYDLAYSALSALTGVQGQLGVTSQRLSQVTQEQNDYVSLIKTMAGDIENVDAAQVAVDVSTTQTQLEASYQAIAMISKVHLVNYL
jgi:flagellar hook-associated protein 3 FlgL